MAEAVAPSRAMRSRANRRESSVARGIELDSPSLKSTDLAGLYHVERPRETWCRNFARNLVSRDRTTRTRTTTMVPTSIYSPQNRKLERRSGPPGVDKKCQPRPAEAVTDTKESTRQSN